MKCLISLLFFNGIFVQQAFATRTNCPDLPASITLTPVEAAYYDSYGLGYRCDSLSGSTCYFDGTTNQCYPTEMTNCRALPSNITWPPIGAAYKSEENTARCHYALNCYFDGTTNQCYPNTAYDQCPDLPNTTTWAPDFEADFDVYGNDGWTCSSWMGSGWECYNDGTKNQCYKSAIAMANCPALPASVTWLPTSESFHNFNNGNNGKRDCYSGYSCYFDGTSNSCYHIEGQCPSKPENVTVPPTSLSTAGRCPEDYSCYNDNGVNGCYCHDTMEASECHKYYYGTGIHSPCLHKRNQCARTCGWCF